MLTVRVAIPAHNEASRIGRAIQSVLGQTRSVDEIIVVDADRGLCPPDEDTAAERPGVGTRQKPGSRRTP
jgi:hypothetical protein